MRRALFWFQALNRHGELRPAHTILGAKNKSKTMWGTMSNLFFPLDPTSLQPFATSLHQAGLLQCRPDPGVAVVKPVLFPQFLVEMLHVEIEVAVPVQWRTFSRSATGTRLGLGRRLRQSHKPL